MTSPIGCALEEGAVMSGTPVGFLKHPDTQLEDCACLVMGSSLSCCSCCQSGSADDNFSWLGNGLLSAFCSQLQVALSRKQTPAPTVAAVGVAINSREQLTRQECLGCGIFYISFSSAGLREHTSTCLCVHISKAAASKQ